MAKCPLLSWNDSFLIEVFICLTDQLRSVYSQRFFPVESVSMGHSSFQFRNKMHFSLFQIHYERITHTYIYTYAHAHIPLLDNLAKLMIFGWARSNIIKCEEEPAGGVRELTKSWDQVYLMLSVFINAFLHIYIAYLYFVSWRYSSKCLTYQWSITLCLTRLKTTFSWI